MMNDKINKRELLRIDRFDEENENQGQLIDEEEALSGTVTWRTYFKYFKSRGWILFLFSVLLYGLFSALQVWL